MTSLSLAPYGLQMTPMQLRSALALDMPNIATAINAAPAGGGGNITPDTHPTTPTAWDDEFEFGSAIDTTGARFSGANPWTPHVGSGFTISGPLAQGALQAVVTNTTANAGAGYTQPVPAGSWEFTTKLRGGYICPFNLPSWGSCYFGSTSPGSDSFLVQYETTRNWDTGAYAFGGSIATFTLRTWPYLKIRYDGTNLFFYTGLTGLAADFILVGNGTAASFIGGAPTHIGLGNGPNTSVDFFRRTA